MKAAQPSSRPTATDPTPSHLSFPVSWESSTPRKARKSPMRAAESSSSTTGSSGVFVRWTNCRQPRPPRTSFASRIAVRSENDSRIIDRPSTA